MASEEGGNATASRSKRTRQPPPPPEQPSAAASEVAGADATPQQPQEQEGNNAFLPILNWLMFFFVMQNVLGPLVAKFTHMESGPTPPSTLKDDFVSGGDGAVDGAGGQTRKPRGVTDKPNNRNMMLKPACLWQVGTVMDLDVAITDSPTVPKGWPALTTPIDVDDSATEGEGSVLASWREEELILGGVKGESDGKPWFLTSDANQEMNRRNATLAVPLTKAVWNNETHVYAFVRLQRRRHFPDGTDSRGDSTRKVRNDDVLVKRMPLTRYRKRKKMRDVKSLLDAPSEGSTSPSVDPNDSSVLTAASLNKTGDQILLYMKPSLTLQIVEIPPIDFPTRSSVPKQFSNYMDWYGGEEGAKVAHGLNQEFYYPILYQSEFWITFASLREVNGTLKESKLEATFEPVSMWKWSLQSQTEENWRKQESFTGEEDHGNDMLRNMLLETSPWLLGITALVSALHTIFDVLAFKNDISFFKKKKSLEGLSLRSMVVNAGFSLIILLYLADNETSYMVLMSNGVGLAIEVWKISKAITIKFEGGRAQLVQSQSYKKSKTREYDEIATSHLLFVTMPLVAGYGVYSLFYQKHKGWYSWILSTLVGFIYMFGFVMMTPQLFINYKLQSVAHLNMKTMTYKSLNTFIDDLFAFVIKMPIMHRLACLRDDVIFFIFLYQRYKYKTDLTRVNEFGQCAEPTEEMLAEQEQETPAEPHQDATSEPGTLRRRRGARDKRD